MRNFVDEISAEDVFISLSVKRSDGRIMPGVIKKKDLSRHSNASFHVTSRLISFISVSIEIFTAIKENLFYVTLFLIF